MAGGASIAKDLGSIGYGALTSGIINPASVFGLVGAFGGVSDESRPGAFYDKQFRRYKTDRASHVADGRWRFLDPGIGADFEFTQDRIGNYHILDPLSGKSVAQNPFDGLGWNLHEEQMKVFAGGGADTDFTAPLIPGRDPSKKSVPWQMVAARTGPMYNPITAERIAQARTFQAWEVAQRERNRQAAMAAAAAPNPFMQGGGFAGIAQRAMANQGKSYWEMTGTPKPPVLPSGIRTAALDRLYS